MSPRLFAYATVLAHFALVAPQCLAQEIPGTVASLVEMSGNVLVARESSLISASEALRLLPGTRVLTSVRSEAVIQYDDGCRVELRENERVEIETSMPCGMVLPGAFVTPHRIPAERP